MDPYPLKWGFSIAGNYGWFLSFAENHPDIDMNILVAPLMVAAQGGAFHGRSSVIGPSTQKYP
jgi:hypothetical protein